MADCAGTGYAALAGSILPFGGGSAISSLVSAINTANTAFLTQSTAFVGSPANPSPDQEGGGVWARGIGGEIKTKNTTTTSNVTLGGVGLPGQINCNNDTKLQFSGVQVGTDFARLNWNGWNVHIGSTVGYLGAKASDTSSAGPLNPLGGTFQDSLQVPFAGVYAAATKGGFFIDGQFRLDYYQNNINDPIVNGIFNQKVDARGWAFSGNIGYNHSFGNSWFIEPSAGIVVSTVKVDPLNITGGVVLPASFSSSLTWPGQLQVDDIKSTLGRFSVRAGTTIVTDKIVFQPFATASVYHEFQGSSTASINSFEASAVTGLLPMTATYSTTTLGTYGQFAVGVAGQVLNTGWLGYVRADYRTGDKIDGYSLNGGIRYQFSPEKIAAPLYGKVKAPVYAQTAYNWTGFFIGGSFGLLNGKTDYEYPANGATTNPRYAGATGGGQIGYDQQFGKWILGVEGNIYAADAHGARACPNNVFFNCESKMDWIGTATVRVGYSFWDRQMAYVRAGAAYGNTKLVASCNTGPFNVFGLVGCGQGDSQTAVGWTIGYGTEFALDKNWTVRAESNYFDLGTTRFTEPQNLGATAFAPLAVDVRNKGFISTIGLNYRFSTVPGPVIAKY